MLTITSSLMKGALSLRPLCKETDRAVVRELFRQEFYGARPQLYPDEGLWEIYDSMETNDAFGAYLVFYQDRLIFLLEVHPAVQMDLSANLFSQPGTIGIYCFYASRDEHMNLPALRACIDSLLHYPTTRRIVTRVNFISPGDPRVELLEKAGFRRHAQSPDRAAVFFCDSDTFPLLGRKAGRRRRSLAH
jgi:hypothetical protein